MFYQILSLRQIGMLTDVDPSTVERVADDGLVLRNKLLYEVSSVEECLFRDLCKGTLLDEVDAGIGVIVIFRFLQESCEVAAFQIQDAEWNAYVMGNGGY